VEYLPILFGVSDPNHNVVLEEIKVYYKWILHMFDKIKKIPILLLSTSIFLSTRCDETKYTYYGNGKVEVKEVSNKNGLVLWQYFSDSGRLLTDDHYLNDKNMEGVLDTITRMVH
jgi:hypothetical protein